jgi:hypothetical protein
MPHIHFNPIRLGLALVAVLAVALPSTAQAKTQHHYKSTILNGTLSTANGYPGVGGTAVTAGTWNSDLFGKGALVDHVTITGNPAPSVIAFGGTEFGFVSDGSLKSKFTGTSTVHPDGSQTISVTGRYVGGTGPYKHATGSFKFNGSTEPGGSVITGRSTGTISY